MPTTYLEENQQRFLSELLDWLRIPSVSADPKFRGDVLRAADYLKQRLEEVGLDKVELCPTAGYPIVYGEKLVDPALPTVLVYGHYDVQPADPYALWDSHPSSQSSRTTRFTPAAPATIKGRSTCT